MLNLNSENLKEEILEIIKETIKEVLGLNLDKIDKNMTLKKMNLDSIDLFDLVTRLESKIQKRFNIPNYQVPDEYFTKLRDSELNEVIDIIYNSLK